MTKFKSGRSGNPSGRPLSFRLQIHCQPYFQPLVPGSLKLLPLIFSYNSMIMLQETPLKKIIL